MKSLPNALERLSFSMHHAVKGRITATTQPRLTARRATRARLGLQCLETRDLMSGMTLTTSFSNATPAYNAPPGPPVILPPASLVATAVSPTVINLAWNDQVDDAIATTVFENNGTGWSTLTGLSGDPKAYTVTGLNPDSAYDFYVTILSEAHYIPIDGYGLTTSNVVATRPPAAPVFSLSAASAGQVNVSWNTVAGATGYLVDEMVDGAWVQVGDLSATSDSMSVIGLMPHTSYEFRVAAVNPAGTTWSAAQSVSTPPLYIGLFPVIVGA